MRLDLPVRFVQYAFSGPLVQDRVLYTGQLDGNWQCNDQARQNGIESMNSATPSIIKCTHTRPLHLYWPRDINQPLCLRLMTGQTRWPIWYGQLSNWMFGLVWGYVTEVCELWLYICIQNIVQVKHTYGIASCGPYRILDDTGLDWIYQLGAKLF